LKSQNYPKLPNGNLELFLADQEEREELQDLIFEGKRGYWSLMADLFEPHSCNGEYTSFDPANGNPFVGLTDAPCIAESMDILDDGTQKIDGNFWYFDGYVTDLETELLANGDKVIYTLVK